MACAEKRLRDPRSGQLGKLLDIILGMRCALPHKDGHP